MIWFVLSEVNLEVQHTGGNRRLSEVIGDGIVVDLADSKAGADVIGDAFSPDSFCSGEEEAVDGEPTHTELVKRFVGYPPFGL